MKKAIDYWKERKLLTAFCAVFSVAGLILFFASSKHTLEKLYYTETFLPYLVGVLVCVPFLLFAVNAFFIRKRFLDVVVLVVGALSFVCVFLFLAYCISKLTYFFMAGTPYYIVFGLAAVLVGLFFYAKACKKVRNAILIGLAAVFAVVAVFGVLHLLPVSFDSGAVVFAVEDEYQICWSTSSESVGSVTVGEKTYGDSEGGALVVAKIHKVCVPRAELEQEKSYTVYAKGMFLNRAYFANTTAEKSVTYAFRPVDETDGLQLYAVSDNHLWNEGAIRAGGYWGDKLDILIANGDHLNDVSADWQVTRLYQMLSAITDSARPVLITRGNHEAVGTKLSSLPRYFGSREETFYYKARFGDTLFLILDVANDMNDDKKIISATADFNAYRAQEVEWLRQVKEEGSWKDEGVQHVVGLCHMAFPIALEGYHKETSLPMLRLTEEMNMELMLCGHSHRTVYYEVEAETNEANYPVVLGSIRNDNDATHESASMFRFTGTAVEIKEEVTVRFTNAKKEVREEHTLSDVK